MTPREWCKYFQTVGNGRNTRVRVVSRGDGNGKDNNRRAAMVISLSEFPIAGGAGMMWPKGCGSGQLPHVCVK